MSPINEVLIEESLVGWKEYEMEVIRDYKDNPDRFELNQTDLTLMVIVVLIRLS